MASTRGSSVDGIGSTLKYKMTVKPLRKLLVDMGRPLSWVMNGAKVKRPHDFGTYRMTLEDLDRVCEFLGVPPDMVVSFELKDA